MILLSLIVSLLFSLTLFFFFNDTATTEIYTLSLHDALPISNGRARSRRWHRTSACQPACETDRDQPAGLAPERIARYFPARSCRIRRWRFPCSCACGPTDAPSGTGRRRDPRIREPLCPSLVFRPFRTARHANALRQVLF